MEQSSERTAFPVYAAGNEFLDTWIQAEIKPVIFDHGAKHDELRNNCLWRQVKSIWP
jgi:hypothetical protein